MAQSFFPITPVEVTPGTANDWIDIDLSSYIPSGGTGALFHVVNNYQYGYDYYFGIRKKGSTDDRHARYISGTFHCWAAMGVDADRHCEIYVGHVTRIDIYLVGYTMSGVTFFDNGYPKTPATSGSFQEVDCSGQAPNAIGLIFEMDVVLSGGSGYGLRMPGSSDWHYVGVENPHDTFGAIVGCDSNQKIELYRQGSNTYFYLIGYITDGAGFYQNGIDMTPETEDEWVDLDALPSGSYMGFFDLQSETGNSMCGLRKNGSAEDIRKRYNHCFAFVECNNSIIEGWEKSGQLNNWLLIGIADTQASISVSTYAFWM